MKEFRTLLSAYANGTPVSPSGGHLASVPHCWVTTAVSALRLMVPPFASLTRSPTLTWTTFPASAVANDVVNGGVVWNVTGQSCCTPSSGAHWVRPSPFRSP